MSKRHAIGPSNRNRDSQDCNSDDARPCNPLHTTVNDNFTVIKNNVASLPPNPYTTENKPTFTKLFTALMDKLDATYAWYVQRQFAEITTSLDVIYTKMAYDYELTELELKIYEKHGRSNFVPKLLPIFNEFIKGFEELGSYTMNYATEEEAIEIWSMDISVRDAYGAKENISNELLEELTDEQRAKVAAHNVAHDIEMTWDPMAISFGDQCEIWARATVKDIISGLSEQIPRCMQKAGVEF
ncbi:hypothetical protein BZA77DRAFT_383923 [Pyronema omphalodes]|nr:hypothetical protein BZA77DRAFT_383923 [Pyronema omphalodes]